MTSAAHRLATYADIEALRPGVTGQILDGELIVNPRPAAPHAQTASVIGMYILAAYQVGMTGPGGWRIFDELELHLDDAVLVPDLAGWRESRWRNPEGAAAEIVPDWICEVLSPSTIRFDRTRKLQAYARFGVEYAWLVHPVDCTIEAYARQGEQWLLQTSGAGNEGFSAAPFDELTIPLRMLWLNPPDNKEETQTQA